jgi:hypothetical protein
MAKKFDYDFSGYATKANTLCYDGLTIAPDAFKGDDGRKVPVVWNHDHSDPEHVLGHALLQNRKDGVYAYVKMNDSPSGQSALEAVRSGDIDAMSIFANGLKKAGQTVMHGVIRELSLVLAGCNPGALIDEIVEHSADYSAEEGEEAFIYTDGGISLKHGLDPDDNPLDEEDEIMHSEDEDKEKSKENPADKETTEETVKEVFNSLTEKQKNVVYAIVGMVTDGKKGADNKETDNDKEDETVKHNVFDNDKDQGVLKHSIDEINAAMADGKRCGSMKDAFIQHGIEDVEWLFPEDHLLDNPPRIIDNDQTWVGKVMSSVHHIPFSRIKSMSADLTEEDARAKGYIKGNFKKEQVFGLLKRSTSPTTVYKKQKMDRDDIADITSFDVIAWLKQEMRTKLNEELARAYLIGDGRNAASDDKINEGNIRPIYSDDDFYTIKVQAEVATGADTETKIKAAMNASLKARKDYKGSGNPTLFTTEDNLTDMLLLEDKIGHRLYKNEAEVAQALRVKEIVTVPQMAGMKGTKGGELFGIVVNLADYTVGADKGGAVNMFDDFDIDYNQQKYLIETRCSGALTVPFSAMAIEYKAA